MIRIAIADDSPFSCRVLASFLESSGRCQVVGVAHDAAATVALVRAERPDVLTLDLEMPGGGGLELLRKLAVEMDGRVVVISGVTKRVGAVTMQALALGAADVVLKYVPGVTPRPDNLRREVLAKVIAASAKRRAAVAGRTSQPVTEAVAVAPTSPHVPRAGRSSRNRPGELGVVVVGASTGGPAALHELLEVLPVELPLALLIVQHLPAAFTPVFVGLLRNGVDLAVEEARDAMRLAAGRALVAPGGAQTRVKAGGVLHVSPAQVDDVYRPCIDVAMLSVAETFGPDARGVLLTGMGADGAGGLKCIRERGGTVYIQSPDSAFMASMPLRALEMAGADFVGTPAEIGRTLARVHRGRSQ